MIHDQPCRWGVVTYSLLCVVTVTAKDRCFQHWELHNYLKWRFTDSHSDTTYQIQCRAIHTLHKLSMRCAACKEARYLSPSHSDCDFFLNDLWPDHCVLAKHASRPTVQYRSWDCETAMIGVAVKLHFITFQPVEDADAQNNFNEKYMRSGFENSLSPGHHDIWGIDRVCVCQALSSLDITDISYSISLPWGSKMTRIHTFWNVLNRGCLIMFSNVMFVLTLFTVLLFSSFGPSWHCFGPKCP